MSSKLFLDEELKFEKTAMSFKLSSDSQVWPQEINSELYRQHPFLSDYSVRIDLSRMDPEKGYAFGNADIGPESEGMFDTKARIPLIVKEGRLQPVDVYFDKEAEAFPLTEDRMRETLFRGNPVEPSNGMARDKGMVDQLYLPIRTNYGYGTSGGSSSTGIGKMASGSLLAAIASTITSEDADAFISAIDTDMQLKTAALKNRAFSDLAYVIVEGAEESNDLEKRAEKIRASIVPTVVMLSKLASGNVEAQWSNPNAFDPSKEELSPLEAKQAFGDAVTGLPVNSFIVASTAPKTSKVDTLGGVTQVIDKEGSYSCTVPSRSANVVGRALPIHNLSGEDTGSFIFLSQDGYAVQDKIAGEAYEGDVISPDAHPKGWGVFYSDEYSLPPTHVDSVVQIDETTSYITDDTMGNRASLVPTLGLRNTVKLAEDTYAVPVGLKFAPLNKKIDLASETEDFEKAAMYRNFGSLVEVRGMPGGFYHIEGAPLEKIADGDKTYLTEQNATFLLANMGLTKDESQMKLAEAAKFGRVSFFGANRIIPIEYLEKEARAEAIELLEGVELPRISLVKEAAALEDSQTVDTVLALNFINPDNMHVFLGYLPELEDTMSKVAEMLVASRLGLSQVPELALERSMKGLDAVVSGLKTVHHKLESSNE